jgi:predicted transcriptional regulator
METIFNDSYMVPVFLFNVDDITPFQKMMIISILNSHHDEDGICRVKQTEIAKNANINYNTFRNCLADLKRKGYVDKVDGGLVCLNNGKRLMSKESTNEKGSQRIGRS